MNDENSKIELFSVNSRLNNSLIKVVSNFNNLSINYPEIPDLSHLSKSIASILEPMIDFQSKFQAYSKELEGAKFSITADLNFEAFQWWQNIQKIQFFEIADNLDTTVVDLQFKAYDLSKVALEDEERSKQEATTESNVIRQVIQDIYSDNKILYEIEPRRFEEVVAELLYHQGFEVELTKQTRDGGFDILALRKIGGFPIKFLVNCKKHAPNRPIGIEIIRSFCDVIKEEKANKGIICTTSYFTKESRDRKEKEGHLLDFIDRIKILNWVEAYLGIKN